MDQDLDFAPFAELMLHEGLPPIVVDSFKYYYGVLASGDTGFIGEQQIEPVTNVANQESLTAYMADGREAIGRTAMLKLNGGLGTSMGLAGAKSLLVAHDGLTFLDIIARQILRSRERYQCQIPLLLMNSFNTDADTRERLAHYPELEGGIPMMLMQHKVPKVLRETLAPASWPDNPSLEWCPPGHGEIYIVLQTSGVLDTLLANGYEYLFISNIDNLGATLDLNILGYFAAERMPFLMEVAERTETDKKGGHIARLKNGQLTLREVAQCPPEDMDAFQDIARHGYFNTNNIWLNLPLLQQVLGQHNGVLKLPMIRNSKPVNPQDPTSPGVFQLETAMGTAISVFKDAQALQVKRERFLPVKTCGDLLRLRSDRYELDADCQLHKNPAATEGGVVLSLDPRYYELINDFDQRFPEGPPSLVNCSELSVQGDVLFEPVVTLNGTVQVVNRAVEQGRVPTGSVLTDTLYEANP